MKPKRAQGGDRVATQGDGGDGEHHLLPAVRGEVLDFADLSAQTTATFGGLEVPRLRHEHQDGGSDQAA